MKLKFSLLALLIYIALSGSVLKAQNYNEPFWNQELPTDVRVKDLLSRLTAEEKISLMIESSPGIPRLGVPKYQMGNEALHGVVRPGAFTVFPQAIGLAAMWNPELMQKTASAISDEARGRWNELERGKLQKAAASDLLVFWSPDINLARDPRWGRTQETYGEDPYLSAKIGVAFIKGLQGDDPNYLKVVATPKHYTANNEEHNRFKCNAIMSERSLREYYLVPFEYAIKEGKAQSIMTAYNAINGIPCTASKKLLTDILRNEWGFNGYVTSDCGAPGFMVVAHKYFSNFEESAVACLNAGLDLECGGFCGTNCFVYRGSLKIALDKGLIKESQIDSSAYRILRSRFMLGVFDRDLSTNPYNSIPASVVGCKKNVDLALKTAQESIVLLKNKNNALPLDVSKIKSIALFGPNSDNCVFGDYSAKISANPTVSVLQGLQSKLGSSVTIKHISWEESGTRDFPVIPVTYFHVENSDKKGLYAEYFNNKNFEGTPNARIDDEINFSPKDEAPDPFVPQDEKSIRWTSLLTPKVTGKYSLAVDFKNNIKLYVNDMLLIDQTKKDESRTIVDMSLIQGEAYKIRFEYSMSKGDDLAKLRWKLNGTVVESMYNEEIALASKSDVVIAVMGLNRTMEREGRDKENLELPQNQQDFLKAIYEANPNTIVVLQSGSPLAVKWLQDNVPAIVNAYYAGEQGGNAITDVLLGKYNPAGRLPCTYYKSTEDLLPFDDYEIMKGRTYMYSDKTPLYPFGYGLSYTSFEYSKLKLAKTIITKNDSLKVAVQIKNTGKYDGDEVVQLYVRNNASKQVQPIKALRAFKRVNLKQGESKTIELTFPAEELRTFYEKMNRFMVDAGSYELMIGASSDDIRLKKKFKVK